LLTGIRVFQCVENDIDGVIKRVIDAKIEDPRSHRDLPESTAEIVMRSLQKNQEDRYQTAGEFGYALEQEIYSHGYGPTIITLSKYVREFISC